LIIEISPSTVRGEILAPPSKSMTHRAIFCSALSKGTSKIFSPLVSDDTEATCRVLKNIGVEIIQKNGVWEIRGGELTKPSEDLYCGESGTTPRMTTAVCALVNGTCRLTGGPSLSQRPIEPLLEALRQLDIDCESQEGHLPVTVKSKGRIKSGEVKIRGDISSQFISALLLISPFTKRLIIKLTTGLESKPYVKMTIDTQKRFGVEISNSKDMRTFSAISQAYKTTSLKIEGDWSSASYFLSAGALAGEILVKNLNFQSHQADKEIIKILEDMGAHFDKGKNSIKSYGTNLRAIEYNLKDTPDLFPIVASLCAVAKGCSTLTGLERLRYKESDRVKAMSEGLRRMNIKVKEKNNSIMIKGGTPVGSVIDPYRDHRIAMSLAILGLIAKGNTKIINAECVSKSYPEFWGELKKMGALMRRK
jgi:3-phosphoshikimate 1-carboxyvinyltransferase